MVDEATLQLSHLSVAEALQRFRGSTRPIQRYLALRELKTHNSFVFYTLLIHNMHEILPYVYTPTVGEACQKYHRLPTLQPWGLYITLEHQGHILERLQQWPQKQVKVAVATDGERVLGLGDLGAGGMGIAEGKIMLYTVAAGVDPDVCCPICLDVGTNNASLLEDSLYKGLRRRRPPRSQYDAFMSEFMHALREWQPHMLLQFEDFHNTNAFRLLKQNQLTFPCFNDDIQGTACVALAGILSAIRATSKPLHQHLLLFLGAGEAGVGIGELVSQAIAAEAGCGMTQARQQCYFVDSKGLVVQSREGLQAHKKRFAHAMPPQPDFLSALRALRPSIIIGVSTAAGAFDTGVLQAMAEYNDRPIVFPLSNPTQLSECTFHDAYSETDGRVLFASGSPFQPEVSKLGHTVHPAQANNAYVFPAVGHAAVLSQARSIPDEVFLVAARALSRMTSQEDLEAGWIFPSFDRVLATSKPVMQACCEFFAAQGLGCKPGVAWEQLIDESIWMPPAPSKL